MAKPVNPNKRHKSKSTALPVCKSCGEVTSANQFESADGLCQACWYQPLYAHRDYLQTHAMVIARLGAGFTEDLFSSDLGIEADGCYIQQVKWHDPKTRKNMCKEQIECYAPHDWQQIFTEIQSLYPHYRPSQFGMDDLETFEISFRSGDHLHTMQYAADWPSQDTQSRFRHLWMQIHHKSQWLNRLTLLA